MPNIDQRQILEINTQEPSSRLLVQDATRMGSLGLLLFATTALITGVVLPMMLLRRPREEGAYSKVQKEEGKDQHPTKSIQNPIQRVWMWSHVLYATCILSTFLVKSLLGTYTLVGLCGISWAVTIWAPFSLISMEIRNEEEEEADTADDGQGDGDIDLIERRSGIVMTLHNAAISTPQIVAVIISSIVFRVCTSSSSNNLGGTDSGIVWTLRITALSALVAAVMAKRGQE
jgi:solute carrier family 45 protein 1/2/4